MKLRSSDIVEYEAKSEGDKACTKSFLWGIVIGLFIAAVLIIFVDIAHAYTVKPGDTLSGIAQEQLGDWSKYKELAKINKLSIEVIDGIDYVWLKVGQELLLDTKVKQLTRSEAISILNQTVSKRAHYFFRDRDITINETEIKREMELCANLLANIIEQYHGSHSQIKRIEKLTKRINKLRKTIDYYKVTQRITYAISVNFPTATGEELLEFGLWIFALMECESGYQNIRGQHGEYGWYQIKPTTFEMYSRILGIKQKIRPSLVIEHTICLATGWITRLFNEYLLPKYNGSWQHALQEYNSGSKKLLYSQRVYQTYRKLREISKEYL